LPISNFIFPLLFDLKKIIYEKNDLTHWRFLCRFDHFICLRSIYQQQELESLLCGSYK